MQTRCGARHVVHVADILVFTVIYFVTMVSVVGHFDFWLLLRSSPGSPVRARRGVVRARLARSARTADARSLMTGRVTDAYTNIAR